MLEATQAGTNLDFASGISAMPSMHVAMATLFAIAGFRRSRLLGGIFTVYALTIWVASVHLGWHYALDGVVGAAMMGALWSLSKPIARILAR
jgi:membrane-associated phospholipid phosphatase